MRAGVTTEHGAGASIDQATSLGAVSLTVSDLGRARTFYEQVLGLVPVPAAPDNGPLALTDAGGGPALVVLHEDLDAAPFDPRRSGLFHLAILVPSRIELARALRRIADTRWPLSGASDHLVSEALYLRDPDGNGIEIYRDRPRDQWPSDDQGAIRMDTLRLDLSDLLGELDAEAGSAPASTVAAGTQIGHVHLQISELDAAERFYHGVLGFDVTVRSYPGALFVSAGGYHHHIGLNTWQTLGAPPPAPGGVGLRSFEVLLPDGVALTRVLDRIGAAGLEVERLDGDLAPPGSPAPALVHDPFGIAVVLRSA
ncbi:MAG: VOC family protein [Solirubrobacteraceae bacterium]